MPFKSCYKDPPSLNPLSHLQMQVLPPACKIQTNDDDFLNFQHEMLGQMCMPYIWTYKNCALYFTYQVQELTPITFHTHS